MKTQRFWRLLILSLLVGMALTACDGSDAPPVGLALPPEGTYDIDNQPMTEFHNRLGGQDLFGYAISTVYTLNGKLYLYTEGGLLVVDPNSNTTDRFKLEPIGEKLDIMEPPRAPLADERLTDDGYPLYNDFNELYDFYGYRFTGKALTNPILRPDLNRIEQYFENMGFVIDLTPGAKPRLLSYGVYACDFNCRYQPIENTELSLDSEIPEPFASYVDRIGISLVGVKVSDPYIGQDGNIEMVFSNMVLYYDAAQKRIFARPITEILGFGRSAAPKIDDPANYVFYPLQGILGYNVKVIGQDFISLHGGLDMIGLPTTEVFELGGLEWQCFANMCLTYDPSQPEAFQVRPAALGKLYFGVTYDEFSQTSIAPTTTPSMNSISVDSGLTLRTAEKYQHIAPDEQQTLLIEAFQNTEPLVGAILEITISASGIDTFSITAPPTQANGTISVVLPNIPVPDDTLVFYNVCLDSICTEGTFLIWELK